MPGPSPKRKDLLKKSTTPEKNLKDGSDYRLILVLGGALALAIVIIVAVLLTTPL